MEMMAEPEKPCVVLHLNGVGTGDEGRVAAGDRLCGHSTTEATNWPALETSTTFIAAHTVHGVAVNHQGARRRW